MDLHRARLMDKPSNTPGYCIVCGRPYPTRHHPVPRSAGGLHGPELHLCGHGTAGCHGRAEARRLHFRYDDRWYWLATTHPTKYADALELPGWLPCPDHEVEAC